MPTAEPTQTNDDYVLRSFDALSKLGQVRYDLLREQTDHLEKRLLRIEDIVEAIRDQLRQEEYMPETLILNVTQAARALGVSRTTLYKLVESGRLPARKFATSEDTEPRTVILSEDLKTFLAELPSAEGQPAS